MIDGSGIYVPKNDQEAIVKGTPSKFGVTNLLNIIVFRLQMVGRTLGKHNHVVKPWSS